MKKVAIWIWNMESFEVASILNPESGRPTIYIFSITPPLLYTSTVTNC